MSYRSRIPAITAELALKMDAAAAAGAELVAAGARDRVPVRTGKLREAIHVENAGHGDYEVIAGNTQVFYGHIVEGGGVYTPARPFMIPALESAREEILASAAAILRGL